VLLNLDAIPPWALALAEILALGLLGVTFWHIVKPRPQLRRRIPIALAVLAVLAPVETAIQERASRVAVWLIVVVSLTFALTALGRRGRVFPEYWRIFEKYGKDSKELRSYAWKVVLRIIVICAVLLVLSAIFIKDAYTQGT
jgi:hypothetical protein